MYGGPWGAWGEWKYCIGGFSGVNVQNEPPQGVNTISLTLDWSIKS